MNGLLLIGGKSSRMGSNKSEIIFRDGLTQKQRGIQLLETVCDKVFLSVRESPTTSKNAIVDAFGDIGPLGAIASAQQADPTATWLILACDLPLLESKHLVTLTEAHSDQVDATYFNSATDKLPEPLCAIWGPSSSLAVQQAINDNKRCPRSVLKHLKTNSLPSPGLWPLANTNTEADAIEIRARLNQSNNVKNIAITYFAQLREITGLTSEIFQTDSTTPAGVFEELKAKYPIPHKRKNMMVAVNGDFVDWSASFSENDEIVFIPPVAGG